jgi:hypothetical protein
VSKKEEIQAKVTHEDSLRKKWSDTEPGDKSLVYLLTCLLTELSPSWGAVNCAAPQEPPQHFYEPESSISCSQEPSTGPYPEPYQSNPLHPILSL